VVVVVVYGGDMVVVRWTTSWDTALLLPHIDTHTLQHTPFFLFTILSHRHFKHQVNMDVSCLIHLFNNSTLI
jgi:hypothetical protein